ncbi:MAG: hypothetical protein AAF707_01525 [Pseudomonadota bacterium]
MPRLVELTSHLECHPDEAWRQVQTSALLQHVTHPLIRFVPRGGDFPAIWQPGEYRAWMFLFGLVPLGWQAVVISHPAPDGNRRYVRDDGYSPLIKSWDHWVIIEPDERADHTRYTDRVLIDAGVLTPLIALFARIFYAHRQRRWRALAKTGFAALGAKSISLPR